MSEVKDKGLRPEILKAVQTLKEFVHSRGRKVVYYQGNFAEDVLSTFSSREANDIFREMGKYLKTKNLHFFQKKTDREYGYYDYIAMR